MASFQLEFSDSLALCPRTRRRTESQPLASSPWPAHLASHPWSITSVSDPHKLYLLLHKQPRRGSPWSLGLHISALRFVTPREAHMSPGDRLMTSDGREF